MQDCRRLALLLEYDGYDFHGFQDQAGLRTVQQVVQTALRDLTGEHDLQIIGSSRTDRGVHARGLVCHLDSAMNVPLDRLPLALNCRLPEDVAILAASEVLPGFHARYDAAGKIYTYRYYLSSTRPVLCRHQAVHVFGTVDINRMKAALPYFCGTHDFYAFMDQNNNPRHSTIRTIHQMTLAEDSPYLTLKICGDGFLYHMVRIIAGTLLAIGQGKIDPEAIPQILRSRNRRLAGKTMPPQGLCLESVLYPFPLFNQMEVYHGKNPLD